MSIPVIAFFSNKGGVGKTTMVYHLAYMFADMGLRVVAADLDPQCNLTAAFLDQNRLEEVVQPGNHSKTIFGALEPIKEGLGDVGDPFVEKIDENLNLIAGDMALSTFEDGLSEVWPKCMDGDPRAFRVTTAFYRVMQSAAKRGNADVVLVDLGPDLGAINRAALISSDFFVVPLVPDLFSIQGLRNLGPVLRRWREEWVARLKMNPVADLVVPSGQIEPLGYVVLKQSIRLDRPVKAIERWIARIPEEFSSAVLQEDSQGLISVDNDPNCLGKLRDYRSLIPLAQEAHKPMFHLKPADGALGAYMTAVIEAYENFKPIAEKICRRVGLVLPAGD